MGLDSMCMHGSRVRKYSRYADGGVSGSLRRARLLSIREGWRWRRGSTAVACRW